MKGPPTYSSGEPVRAGDRINHAGRGATVVAVPERQEFADGFGDDFWRGFDDGFVIRYDDGEVVIWDTICAEDRMELVSRSPGLSG